MLQTKYKNLIFKLSCVLDVLHNLKGNNCREKWTLIRKVKQKMQENQLRRTDLTLQYMAMSHEPIPASFYFSMKVHIHIYHSYT